MSNVSLIGQITHGRWENSTQGKPQKGKSLPNCIVYSWPCQLLCRVASFRMDVEHHIVVFQNDRRYLVLDCAQEERKKMVLAYIDDLDRKGMPPPPTASEPSRRTTK